jgi:hypothetical protein
MDNCKPLWYSNKVANRTRRGDKIVENFGVAAGDPFFAAGRRKELEHIGKVVRRTYPELMAAVREEEERLGRPMLPSEAEEHARAFFAPKYREDLRAIPAKAWEELHEELMREEEE